MAHAVAAQSAPFDTFAVWSPRDTGRLYRAPPLREYIKGKARGPKTACSVCGAPERATKATGCGYLEEAA